MSPNSIDALLADECRTTPEQAAPEPAIPEAAAQPEETEPAAELAAAVDVPAEATPSDNPDGPSERYDDVSDEPDALGAMQGQASLQDSIDALLSELGSAPAGRQRQ